MSERPTPVRPTTVDDLVATAPPPAPPRSDPAEDESAEVREPAGFSAAKLIAIGGPPLAALGVFGLFMLPLWIVLAILGAIAACVLFLARHKLAGLWNGRSGGHGGGGKPGWQLGRARGSGAFSGLGKGGSRGSGLGGLFGGGRSTGGSGGRMSALGRRVKSAASRATAPVRGAATRAARGVRDAVGRARGGRAGTRPGSPAGTRAPGSGKGGRAGSASTGSTGSTGKGKGKGGGKGRGKDGAGSGSSDSGPSRTKTVLSGVGKALKGLIPGSKPKSKDKPDEPDDDLPRLRRPKPGEHLDDDLDDGDPDDDPAGGDPDDDPASDDAEERPGVLVRGYFGLANAIGKRVRKVKTKVILDTLKEPLEGLRKPKSKTPPEAPATPDGDTADTAPTTPETGPSYDDAVDYPPPGPAPEEKRRSSGYDDEIIYPEPHDVPGPRKPEPRYWDDVPPEPSAPDERPRKDPTYDDVPIPPRHAAYEPPKPDRTYDDATNTGSSAPAAHGRNHDPMSSALDQEDKTTPQMRATAFDLLADAEQDQIRDLDTKADDWRKIIRVAGDRANQTVSTQAQVQEAHRQLSLIEQQISQHRASKRLYEQAAEAERSGAQVSV